MKISKKKKNMRKEFFNMLEFKYLECVRPQTHTQDFLDWVLQEFYKPFPIEK